MSCHESSSDRQHRLKFICAHYYLRLVPCQVSPLLKNLSRRVLIHASDPEQESNSKTNSFSWGGASVTVVRIG